MPVIDREPHLNLEPPDLRPANSLRVSDRDLNDIDRVDLTVASGTGRNRFVSKLETFISRGVNLIRSTAEFVRFKGRRGRGPCPGCMVGSEEGHHFGSKCIRRGMGSGFKSRATFNLTVSNLALNSSGLSQFFLKQKISF